MAELNTKPGSSSKRQHQKLVIAASRTGSTVHDVRKLVGGSIRKLSSIKCSEWITHFSGQGLPNPPGQKPRPYSGKPTSGVTRMIHVDQADQIDRLGREYFGKFEPYDAWLMKTFKVKRPRELATAERAGRVIRVLKDMLARRAKPQDTRSAQCADG